MFSLPRLLVLIIFYGLTAGAHAQQLRMMVPFRHSQGIINAKFSPDNKYVASFSYNDYQVRVWDIRTGKLLQNFQHPAADFLFLDDDSSLVSISDTTTIIWNIYTGKKINTMPADSAIRICFLGAMPATKLFYTARGRQLEVWDYHGNKKFSTLLDKAPNNITPAYNDSALLIKSDSTELFTWHFLSGRKETILHQQPFRLIGNDQFFITLLNNDQCSLYERNSGRLLNSFKIYDDEYKYFLTGSLSEKGDKFLLSGKDSSLTLYDTKTGKNLDNYVYRTTIRNMEFVNNDEQYIVYDNNGWAELYRTKKGKHLYAFLSDSSSTESRSVGAFIEKSADKKRYMMAFEDNILRVWETVAEQPRLLQSFSGKTKPMDATAISPKTRQIAFNNRLGEICLYNTTTGSIDLSLPEKSLWQGTLSISPDSKLMAAAGNYDSICKIWELSSGTLIKTITDKNPFSYVEFSGDGQKIMASFSLLDNDGRLALEDTVLKIWDIKGQQPSFGLRYQPGQRFFNAGFTGMAQHIICTNPGDSTVYLLNYQTNNIKWKYKSGSWLFDAKHIEQTNYILLRTFRSFDFLDIETGKLLKSFDADLGSGIGSAVFSPDGKYLITADSKGWLKTREFESGKIISDVKAHESGAEPVLPGDSSVFTVSEDGTIKAWKYPQLENKYQYIPLENNQSITVEPSGYYSGTRNAARYLHYVTPSLGVIGFDQLDARFNRPDLIQRIVNPHDTALVSSYYKAWQKRMKRMNIDTTVNQGGISVPVAEIRNRSAIAYEQKANKLQLDIQFSDSVNRLQHWNVWINEVPLFGIKGKQFAANTYLFDTSIQINLSEKENIIELSATNGSQVESYRMPLTVTNTVKQAKPTLHFIGIGINHYRDTTARTLQWSVQDIKELAAKLKTRNRDMRIDTLFDHSASKASIMSLKQKLHSLSENDKVIIAFSGHGLLSKDLDYYLGTWPMDFSNPEREGLPYEALENLLDGIRPRKKLLLIDACHSGEIDKEELSKMVGISAQLDSLGTKTDTVNKGNITLKKSKLGMKSSFDLMQSLFSNISRGTGAVIISAAGGAQYAQERNDLENGVFTYSILEAFDKNATLKVSQLKEIVNKKVMELTRGLQQPTNRTETNLADWEVW